MRVYFDSVCEDEENWNYRGSGLHCGSAGFRHFVNNVVVTFASENERFSHRNSVNLTNKLNSKDVKNISY